MFEDDLLLFSKVSMGSVRCIDEILSLFAMQSGLKTNSNKSFGCASAAMSLDTIESLASILNGNLCSNLGKYLGVPIFHGAVRNAHFDFIMNKFLDKLGTWKMALLNKAGRITLARTVLTTIPSYIMQTIWVSTAICERIDRLV